MLEAGTIAGFRRAGREQAVTGEARDRVDHIGALLVRHHLSEQAHGEVAAQHRSGLHDGCQLRQPAKAGLHDHLERRGDLLPARQRVADRLAALRGLDGVARDLFEQQRDTFAAFDDAADRVVGQHSTAGNRADEVGGGRRVAAAEAGSSSGW